MGCCSQQSAHTITRTYSQAATQQDLQRGMQHLQLLLEEKKKTNIQIKQPTRASDAAEHSLHLPHQRKLEAGTRCPEGERVFSWLSADKVGKPVLISEIEASKGWHGLCLSGMGWWLPGRRGGLFLGDGRESDLPSSGVVSLASP